MKRLFREAYYQVKPLLPWRMRAAMRRVLMRRQRGSSAVTWPISKSAGASPAHWNGWPNGKRFAFVLTHDVESGKGVTRCEKLMELEMKLEFHSSFNFVPEGYVTPEALRVLLVDNGFEVGVHDLKHDGKLYRTREIFRTGAQRINRYLREWNAVGFRSAFMHHNLDWLHDLNVKYDASTFDTDPFEPQPDGVNTIFPFWVPNSGSVSDYRPTFNQGYVELPYTLAQDSTLFLFLEERSNALWKKKLDWIVEQGGMALINTHPDYMSFNGSARADEFPVGFYSDFLHYVKSRYEGAYWQPLPRDMANFVIDGNAARIPRK